ncbi:MAG: DUF2493 domain-containing protein [Prevotellaceae bacterium]|jgi:hypothetical protein|nr:DUF2493 domain-containing protein [Prevotellaceae bacterium]
MKLAIIGSRKFADYERLRDEVLKNFPVETIEAVVSGGAKGADTLAVQFAREYNIPLIEFLPEWESLGRTAGYERNTLIINEADCVIAFPMKGSCGTWDSVRKAWALDKQVIIVEK